MWSDGTPTHIPYRLKFPDMRPLRVASTRPYTIAETFPNLDMFLYVIILFVLMSEFVPKLGHLTFITCFPSVQPQTAFSCPTFTPTTPITTTAERRFPSCLLCTTSPRLWRPSPSALLLIDGASLSPHEATPITGPVRPLHGTARFCFHCT